jgi:hypothetical protein
MPAAISRRRRRLIDCRFSPQPKQIGHCPIGHFFLPDANGQFGGSDRRALFRRGVGRTDCAGAADGPAGAVGAKFAEG